MDSSTATADARRHLDHRSGDHRSGDHRSGDHRSGGTRSAVRDLLLAEARLTAAEIAARLSLTPAAVRRHLEALTRTGEVEAVSVRPLGGRGRPARAFQLTTTGREPLAHDYDGLAEAALAALAEIGGREAVAEFARRRISGVLGGIEPAAGPEDVPRVVAEIAAALDDAGYAATVRDAGAGVQICQHHCPVWHVASRFPELCAAESELVAELVGSHVQRLATIAGGGCACTTNIPTGRVPLPDPSVPTVHARA